MGMIKDRNVVNCLQMHLSHAMLLTRVIERYEAISDRLCFLNVSPLIAAEGYYFLPDQKVAKNQVSKKTSLRTGLCPAKQTESRAAVFCPAAARSGLRFSKIR
jgi:hypothetical protein